MGKINKNVKTLFQQDSNKMSDLFCLVYGCTYPRTHISEEHKCGKCGNFGHGVVECVKPHMKKLLEDRIVHMKIVFPEKFHCTVVSCEKKHTHSNDSHYCAHCRERHDENSCPYIAEYEDVEKGDAFQRISERMDKHPGKIYAVTHSAMGSSWIGKRAATDGKLELFYMYCDDWGQYGDEGNRVPELLKFLDGFEPLTEQDRIIDHRATMTSHQTDDQVKPKDISEDE